ncbi:sigma-70 family RNA polymerase sigma factor [Aporhodopirellula aestuarii]|uniref:Sigma-70 family RNA polymerase sigma factor n=1 Tax=Aporhodopirellula aestuarii TaxID=2950107 RepID=A0ABT0UDZ3_9BACT|nr:sigma-70 family RNA polymerase sigma factor [Aporhodopirellula aestuarii]MCM2374949.1 sigma-70 family RNA polymerase sigma factor [Aporhodopirellula aestuarii]
MNDSSEFSEGLIRRAREGDQQAIAELFRPHESRLTRMVRMRLNRSIQRRVDPADIVQEAFIEASKRLGDYTTSPDMPFYLWLRHITGQKLVDAHRRHLGTQKRDAAIEISLYRGSIPMANSASLAIQLLGGLTSPSRAAVRAETQMRVQQALNGLSDVDREILAMRHFEQLTNAEVADVLSIDKSTASTRYLRALKRMKDSLSKIPGFLEDR